MSIWNEKTLAIVRGAILKPVKDYTDAESALMQRWLKDHNEEDLVGLIAEAKASVGGDET